jgi:hypothetical protein
MVMADIKVGRTKVRAIKGSQQFGLAGDKDTPQLVLDVTSKDWGGASMSTFLFFSSAAAPFSFQRLWALGWKGKGWQDLASGHLDGIDTNEVDFEVREEEYDGRIRLKGEILTGPGRVTIEKTISSDAFAARVGALLGNVGSGDVGSVGMPMGKDKVPF